MNRQKKTPWFITDGSIELLRDLPKQLRMMLRGMVVAQDHGYALAEALHEAQFEQSFIDRIAVAVHIERLKMVAEGWDVYEPPRSDDKAFMIGLEPYPFKEPRLDKPSTVLR